MTSLKRASGLLLVLALVLGLQAVAYAQTGAASITGLVTDQSGAAVPGVTVVATNQATNVEYTAVTNATGSYDILSVPVGRYVVKAALSGFKTTSTRPITLEAKQIARLDLKMEVGALEDTVEVTAQAPVLQTETATVGEVISANTVQSLPAQRPQRQPAGAPPARRDHAEPGLVHRARNSGGGGRPYINGNREQTNNFLIDGVDMNETVDNRIAYQPSPDALAEISVETNNYAADVGNVAGAVISNVIKSGANQFRGNVFEFYRNSDFDANTLGQQPLRARRRPSARSTSSAPPSAGRSSRTSCSSSWTTRARSSTSPGPRRPRSPRPPGAPGDLSSLLPGTVIRDPVTKLPFPNNQIPLNRISPTALGDPQQHRELPASQPRRDRGHRQLRERLPQHHPRPPGRPPARLERLGQRQALPSLLDRGAHDQDGEDGVRAAPRRPDRAALPQPGAQLEPRLQLVAHQRGPGRVQLDQQHHQPSTTGAASATPTRPTGSPAASRSRA